MDLKIYEKRILKLSEVIIKKIDEVELSNIEEILAQHRKNNGNVVTLLQQIQESFGYIPRHDESVVDAFGNPASYILRIYFDATHFIDLWHSLASRVDLAFNDGGGVHAANWTPATLNADTEYEFEIKYNAGEMILKIDDIIAATKPRGPANFPID